MAELGRVWWSQCLTFRGSLGVAHMVMLEARISTFWDSAGQGGGPSGGTSLNLLGNASDELEL